MHGWSAPQPGWAADPGPLGTGLGLRELGFKLRRGKTQLIRPPKELRGRQVESCEFLSLSIPRPGGPGTSTAAPPSRASSPPSGRTPTHKAGSLATPPQKQAETAPRGRGVTGLGRVWGPQKWGWTAWPGPNCHLSEGLVQLRRGRQAFNVNFSFFFTILRQFQLIRSN